MKRFMTLLALFVLVSSSWLHAQGVEITGTVTSSEDGSPLPGVSVVVQGTTIGTATNFDGIYELVVPEDAVTLVFSYIGMQSQEIAINGMTAINVVLNPDFFNLDEIIVVAYGQQAREAKTGAVGTVNSDQLRDIPETSIDKMLDGKVAGVVISSNSGQPGATNDVRIRGTSSIFAGSQPLYVVDGIPVMQGNQTYFTNTGNALAALNANDIKSITILKDAAAASIYGSRAANGVVLITTKSGASGKSKVTFRTSYGMETLANDNDFGVMPYNDWIDYQRTAIINAGRNPDDPANKKYYYPESYKDSTHTNWLDALTRNGAIYNAELSVEGGNERTTHYFSGAYKKHEGIALGTDIETFQGRINLDHQVNDWMKTGVRINAAHTIQNDMPMQAMYFVNPIFAGLLISPITPIYNDDGTVNLDIPSWGSTNPMATALYEDQWEIQDRFNGNVYLEFQLIEGLKLRTTNTYEYTGGEGRRYWSAKAEVGGEKGYLQSSMTKRGQMVTSNILTFNKAFGDHNVQVIAGQEALKYNYTRYSITSPDVDEDIPFPTTSTAALDNGGYFETAYTLSSYFGLLSYNYSNKYYFQGSLRTDGSSRFGADTRWGTFWSAGLSWNLHNEAFLENLSMINQLKLRGSYGLSGNFEIGDYDQFGLYGSEEYNGQATLAPTQPANPDLGWETNAEYNGGVDFTIFERVSGTFEVYRRLTSNMLLDYPLSRTSGFASIRQNIGELSNTGYEIMLDGQIIRTSDFNFSLGVNIAHNTSEILDLGKDEEFINPGNNRIQHKVGESLYSFYLYDYAGVNPANGEGLWYNEAGDLTNKYSEARRFIAGSPEPKYVGGINTNISYKGLMLDVTLAFKLGHQVLVEEHRYLNSDGNFWLKNQTNNGLDWWTTPGQIAKNPKPVADNSSNSYYYRSTRHMYEGDYLRIKNVTLSYSLPANIVERIHLANLRVFASASNMYTFHSVEFFDPERGVEGGGFGIYPQTKKFSFGLEVSF